MAKIAPSLLSADFANLKEEIKKIENGGADYLHLDVMDGIYVPNITFGPPVIKRLRKVTEIPFDVHLMIDKPERYIKNFVDAGADIITVHEEATIHLHRTIQEIKSYGIMAGVSLNPSTPLENIEYILGDVDLILIMTVNPGFGGQSFIESMKDKIRRLRKIIDERNLDIIIEVDGGVKLNNAKEILNCGAELLVVGSDIFGAEDIEHRTKEFKML
ncbi:ribulose-phosphate 3-epimerase [Tissierella praeacuta DSM 18095]|uniref:Ribulose-phosphate 3-epimerase n=1 Tax=Tissierella praeacuta DSM 18095 TaxID=1123404 RepID=A0A1M4SQB0_9FIRM|nr:ribulose-phosphate 3-epimerase [Tissierella praeacuta]TCU70638.1 ribulose-5-phosphate 3-epimerase [Tissierella praeacuta]SHE34365.1 ribulose-phosphate 3-epimerase [Tissierella praeacuta DSM 18095]SUP01650.1 Ribulose-phosphate 3-epimerase [Tissierella praeacuta]